MSDAVCYAMLTIPGPRIHSISIHGFPNIHGYRICISIILGCQSSIIHASANINIDVQAEIPMQGNSAMDIYGI